MFRKNPDSHHDHSHAHNELDEALELTHSRPGRKKLLVAGLVNFGLMGTAGAVALKSGSQPTVVEAIHDFGDTMYYLVPWTATIRHQLNSERATRWMKRTAYFAAGLASLSMASNLYDSAQDQQTSPAPYSAPAQASFALINGGVAVYLGKKPGSTNIDKSALRHAKTDAATSLMAGVFNTAALAVPILNPIGAVVVGGMTIGTEQRNIRDANISLAHPIHSDEDTAAE